jgi:hypothetical protein
VVVVVVVKWLALPQKLAVLAVAGVSYRAAVLVRLEHLDKDSLVVMVVLL